MRRTIFRLVSVSAVLLGVAVLTPNCGQSPTTTGAQLDFSAVDDLMKVLKATAEASPDYALVAERLKALDGRQQDLLIDSLIKVKSRRADRRPAFVPRVPFLLPPVSERKRGGAPANSARPALCGSARAG